MAENNRTAPSSQAETDLYREYLQSAIDVNRKWTELASMALTVCESEEMAVLFGRLALLVQSTIIPSGLVVGTRGIAAFTNVGESAASRMADRRMVPSAKPGAERVYRTDDLARQMFCEIEPDIPDRETIMGMSKSALEKLIAERELAVDSTLKLPQLRKAVADVLHS